jgi:hypothetical protein
VGGSAQTLKERRQVATRIETTGVVVPVGDTVPNMVKELEKVKQTEHGPAQNLKEKVKDESMN